MPEEQIIYLDPNDELTRVRERIEEAPARHIILVVPQQTQMRSNVGWRLLHARSREMGKEIQVISPDRQVRAVAKAAGFRVRDSQESSHSGKTRPSIHPSTRPPRSVIERRVMQRPRGPSGRGPADSRTLRQREQLSPLEPQPPVQPAQSTWLQQESRTSHPQETITGQGKEPEYPPIEIVEDDEYDRPFEFRVDDALAPSARPLSAQQDEEQQDPYIEDYLTSQRIREAAQSAPGGESKPSQPQTYPFDDVEEFSPSSLPEQHGATFAPEADDVAPDIADIPTDVLEVEFLGDQGDFGNAQHIPLPQWPDAIINEPDETPPPRIYGSRPRSSRSGKLTRRPDLDFGDPDYLPPVEDRSTLTPAIPLRPSGSLNAPRAGSRGAQQPPARNMNIGPVPQARPVTRGGRPPTPPPVPRQYSRPPARRGGRITTFVLVSLLLLLLIGISVLYFGTNATVTITVPSRPLNVSSIKLEATTNPQDKLHNTVASQLLSYNASVSGPGTASGTVEEGNASATGIVNITNNGTVPVTIPTGTVLDTNAGAGSVQFATTANAEILPTNPSIPFVPVLVQAQTAGNSGNVGANTITVVPPESLTAIASASGISSTSQVNLSVTNPAALSGGGAKAVPAVTNRDLQALKTSLHQQLQTKLKAWLKQQLLKGDIQGTPSPDVLGSTQPLAQEQLTQVPPVNQPLTSKTFSGQLSAHITVLVVRADSINTAAQAQLNKVALAMRPTAYVLAKQLPISLGKPTVTASKDGTSIRITLSATGRIMQQVNTQDVSMFLSGKSVDQAKSDIAAGSAGPSGVEDIAIEVTPSFLNIMPFHPDNIHVIVLPDPGSTKP